MQVQDHVAVVTGGASGLGEGCVRALVKESMKVSILDLAEERGEKLASELGDTAIFYKTDVTDEISVQDAINTTVQTFGAIHVAINCAGVGDSSKVLRKGGPMSMEHFTRIVQINLMGTMNVIRLAAEKMLENQPNEDGEKGVIINTSSGAAFEGQIGQAAYSASKAAIEGMTLPIAREFADYGIRVMTISPGLFDTPLVSGIVPRKTLEGLNKALHFPNRPGKPFEFANLVKQIIENPMLNGSTIRLDGALRLPAK